jgi:hypothetical protein
MCARSKIISLLLAALLGLLTTFAGAQQTLKEDAPERYTVQRGDTLWGIAGRYFERPWNWPQLWNLNRQQIRNPHRIYPGDILVLDRRTGTLRVETTSLSPRVREEAVKEAVPTIPPGAIGPFLSRPLIVRENEFDNSPRIMATEESRVIVGTGNLVYAKGMAKDKGENWQIYRRGDRLLDPDSGNLIGYMATYLGEARVKQFGEVSRLEITKSVQEIYTGDALIPVAKEPPVFAYMPRSPSGKIQGRVMSLTDNLYETGGLSVISLSRGTKDGLEVGHVLALYRSQGTSRYSLRTSPYFPGRIGPTGKERAVPYLEEQLDVRNSPIISQQRPPSVSAEDLSKIPDERYGLVMVFRTFERASFGLVMQANRPVAIDDYVTTP